MFSLNRNTGMFDQKKSEGFLTLRTAEEIGPGPGGLRFQHQRRAGEGGFFIFAFFKKKFTKIYFWF